jgi:hypothetical protein
MALDMTGLRERVTTPEAQEAFKRWFDAAPVHSGSVTSNRWGWQVARIVAKNAAVRARGLVVASEAPRPYADTLDHDGIVVIPDYLSPARHQQVRDASDQYASSPHLRDIGGENGSGLRFLSGHVVSDQADDAGAVLDRTFAGDPLFRALAEHVIHRRVRGPMILVFQSLELPAGRVDDQDREQLLHVDKFFSCAKAIYFPDEVTEADSPFVYCPGSHRLTLERLRYERTMSVREAMVRAGRADQIEPGAQIGFERGRNVVGPEFRDRLGLEERPITCAANTLVVVNNRGFHHRGELQPGARRRSLWVNFYPYQRPRYGQVAFRLAKRAVDTDDVPRTLPEVHRPG